MVRMLAGKIVASTVRSPGRRRKWLCSASCHSNDLVSLVGRQRLYLNQDDVSPSRDFNVLRCCLNVSFEVVKIETMMMLSSQQGEDRASMLMQQQTMPFTHLEKCTFIDIDKMS
jgi:hypothetical protein